MRERDRRPGVHARSFGRACAVDADGALVDEALRLPPRAVEGARQPLVEARAVVGGGDGEDARAQSTKSAAAERRPQRINRRMGNGA